MSGLSKWIKILVVSTGLAVAIAPISQAADEGGHTSGGGHIPGGGHSSDGHSSGGKGKGPQYMGGHSSQTHKGGSHHHDGSTGGSKSTEDKIFHGHESDGGHDEGGTEHSHT